MGFVQGQIACRRGLFNRQRDSGICADEKELYPEGDLDLVAIFELRGADNPFSVKVGAILAAQIMKDVPTLLADYLRMIARYLAFGQYDLAIIPPSDHKLRDVYRPALAGQLAFTGDENGLVIHGNSNLARQRKWF